MNQEDRRKYLIEKLSEENTVYKNINIPPDDKEQEILLRSLMNIRMPGEIDNDFLRIQDEYLLERNTKRGIVDIDSMIPVDDDKQIFIWRGDITRLRVGAIVNAANSGMTGCYQPCHNCIDNCIHTYAGVELRNYCSEIMRKQGYEEPTGSAKITPAFNLPCDYVIHTVGPIVRGRLTGKLEDQLRSCYRASLALAEEYGVTSIAFCCISTGVFMFPNERAAELAVQTVRQYKKETNVKMKVIFNVFKDEDEQIYERLLG